MEPIQCHGPTANIVEGSAEQGTCVHPMVLDSGSGISILGKQAYITFSIIAEDCQGQQCKHLCKFGPSHPGYGCPAAEVYLSPSRQAF